MSRVNRLLASGAAGFVMIWSVAAHGQALEIQKTFDAKYKLTKASASRDAIVTTGDTIVLQKDHLLLCGVSSNAATQNVYQNGSITHNEAMKQLTKFGLGKLGKTGCDPERTFVAGEKFWITGVAVKDDGVVVSVISDTFSDVRYYGLLKFPFAKGSPPPADQMAALADQVFKIDNGDSGGGSSGGGAAAPAQAQPAMATIAPPPPPADAAPMAAIAPPPPPTDAAPPTIKLGQTRDQVIATFGQPTKILKPTAIKEIDTYPDMKVTYVHEKVTDIQ